MLSCIVCFFFFKQKTAYEMRISDWSSDVCSSDLHPDAAPGDGELKRLYLLPSLHNGGWGGRLFQVALDWLQRHGPRTLWISVWSENQIGRASCRERVCQYV